MSTRRGFFAVLLAVVTPYGRRVAAAATLRGKRRLGRRIVGGRDSLAWEIQVWHLNADGEWERCNRAHWVNPARGLARLYSADWRDQRVSAGFYAVTPLPRVASAPGWISWRDDQLRAGAVSWRDGVATAGWRGPA